MGIMDLFKREQGEGARQIEGGQQEQMRDETIGKEMLTKINLVLNEYQSGKVNLERRIISSEEWWKLRHWEEMEKEGDPTGNEWDHRPKSAWLFNVILGKHADAVEAYPEPLVLPRESLDKEEAKRLSSILPVVYQQNGFEDTYSQASWTKNISGTAVYGCFWDQDKLNGLGDIAIKRISVLKLFWAPGVSDIQDSPNLFYADDVDIALLESQYPQYKGQFKIGTQLTMAKYKSEDHIPDDKKAVVVDWYYKRRQNGRMVLHYCKYVGTTVLFASENEPEYAETGWYADGLYPFVFDALFPAQDTPCGFGYVDIGKSPQMSIDLINQQLIKSAIMNATPRVFASNGTKVNLTQFADITCPVVDVVGNVDDTGLRFIDAPPPSMAAIEMRNQVIEEMKYTAGNLDVINGGTTGGVTAASGLHAMMESAGRSSKASIKGSYRAFAKLSTMVIERMRQFYELPRQFRIIGHQGEEDFVFFSNEKMQAQSMGDAFGEEQGMRQPFYDVEVSAQKQTPYSRLSQNELAIQLYGLGIFNPMMADQAQLMLDMMDFKGVDELIQKVQQNNQIYQMLQMLMGGQMGGQQTQAPAAQGAQLPSADTTMGGGANDGGAPGRKGREIAQMAAQPQ